MTRFAFFCLLSLLMPLLSRAATPAQRLGPGVPPFAVRSGYKVTLAADHLGEARFMEFDDKGILYLSQPATGSILALREKNGIYEPIGPYVSNFPTVHGLCFHNGWLWFTQSGAVHKARGIKSDGSAEQIVTVIPEGQLPSGGGHWWRSILVTDNAFYSSIGDPGNATDQTQTDREKIWRFNLDGSNKQLFVSGIRNTEKLRLRPGTQEIWGCDHGSDNFGQGLGEKTGRFQPLTDVMPPDEFNHYVEGGFYGHPFVVANKVPRIEFQNRPDILELIAKTIPPAWFSGAHWAPNAFTFLTTDYFPGHKGDAFIAFHGSWNSTLKVGYRVQRVLFDRETGQPIGAYQVVGTLNEDGTRPLARPCDCIEAPDGSVLFSCDMTKRIYRITRSGEAP